MKVLNGVLATLFYLALLLVIYLVHSRYFKVEVVFYDALLDVLIALSIGGVLFYLLPLFQLFNSFEKLLLLVIWLLLGYALAISVPTVIDRSLSFYILEKLEQRGGGILLDHMEKVFTREYVEEHRLIDIRLTEQKASGTIRIENGCVKLTEKGRRLAAMSQYFRKNFLPSQRLINDKYSDDLTEPFRYSKNVTNYQCQ